MYPSGDAAEAGAAGVGKRDSGQALAVWEQAAPSPKKQRRVREAELMAAEVGAPVAFNDICFTCKSSGHWKGDCPFSSPSKRAVQTLVEARATRAAQGGHVARFASVCGGCGNAIVQGRDIVAPMPGGVLVDTVWHHRKCVHTHLAVTVAHADEERTHTLTPEVKTVLEWARAAEPAHAHVQAGPGTGKTQLIVRLYEAQPIPPIVLAFNKDAVAVLKLRGVMNARTFHGYGNRLWRMEHRTARLSTTKVRDIMRRFYAPAGDQSRKHKYRLDVMGLIRLVKKLVSLAKAYVLNPECWGFDEKLAKVATQHRISESLQRTLRRSECVAARFDQVLRMTR